MNKLIKKLRDAVKVTPSHYDLKFDLSKLADELEAIDTQQGIAVIKAIKEKAILIKPMSILDESELMRFLTTWSDDYVIINTDPLIELMSKKENDV